MIEEEIKYNEIEDLDYCLELLEDRDKENYSLSQENNFLKYYIGEKEIEIERLNNIINELNNGIKELDNMFYETFRISQNGYYSISEWELKEFIDKLQELKGSDKE